MNQLLRVRLFGAFEVEGSDEHRLGSRKARTLLKVLSLARGRPVSVDAIVDALWPDDAPAKPAEQVSVLVSRLRGVLGADRLTRTDAGYALAVDWLDVDAAAELCAEAERRLHADGVAMARTAAGAALALARGVLLADEPDAPWAESERAAATRLVARVRHVAADAALRAGDDASALDITASILDDDPYDERAVRTQMSALASSGRQAAALDRYERLRARLAEELGVDPAPETRDLHAAILRQERPVAPVQMGDHTLPGRDTELKALDDALHRVRAGTNLVVLVSGEAGIGKSRLVETWTARAETTGAVVLRGRCDALDKALPLQSVIDALGCDPPPVPTASDPETGRLQLFTFLVDALRRIEGPIVLALDDVHLAGASTAEWIAFATRRARDARLLIVAARRAGEGPSIDATETIELGPLSLEAARIVVGDDRAEELHARSGGNPLFLVELASANRGEELPASVRDAVTARCDGAGAAAPTLRAAAVAGREVDLDLLSGVLRTAAVELLDHLEEGVRLGFLVERRDRFAFRHELVREALVAGTGAARRAFVHREAGRLLVARGDADPLAIAFHARLGGDHTLAAHALGRAAQVVIDRFDHAEAIVLLDQAIAFSDEPDLRLARARVHMARNENEDALRDATAAIALGGGARAVEAAGWAAYYRRDFSTARRLAEDGVRLADDDGLRASCLALAGRVRHSQGDLVGAQERLESATAIARGPERADALLLLGQLRVHQARGEEALDLVRSSLDLGGTYASAPVVGRLSIAHALAMLGRSDEASSALDEADVAATRMHAVRYAGRSDNYRSWIARNLGEPGLADELSTKAYEDAERLPFAEAQAFSLFNRAEGRIDAGDLDAAADLLRRAEPLLHVQQVLAWRQSMRAQLLRGYIALRSESFEEARADGATVAEDAAAQGVERYAVLGRVLEAHARVLSGDAIDVELVGADLTALGRVAALESWWLTADIARDARVDAWTSLAEQHAARIAGHAGVHEGAFRRAVAKRLTLQR